MNSIQKHTEKNLHANDAYIWLDHGGVWRACIDYETSFLSFELLLEALETRKVSRIFVADMNRACYFILQHVKARKMRYAGGNYYKFKAKDMEWISVDHIFRMPFVNLCQELELGRPNGSAVRLLVDTIEDFAGLELGTHFTTIGALAWRKLQEFGVPDEIKNTYPFNVQKYDWYKENNLYRGGLCLVNTKFKDKDKRNLFKYDKNSFFPYVLAYCNMPQGHSVIIKGKPEGTLNDRWLHIKWSANAKFDGLAPHNGLQSWIDQEEWILGDELEELMEWYEVFDIEYIEYKVYHWNRPDPMFQEFVEFYYPQKKSAVGIRRQLVKLILNNTYGKFAENPYSKQVRQDGNKFYTVKEEIVDERTGKTTMREKQNPVYAKATEHSLAVAAKVSAKARAILLRDIRLATKGRPDLYFVYADTDSMILTIPYEDTGDELGKFKFEGRFTHGVVRNKKCYMLYDGEDYECHACGVNRAAIQEAVEGKPWNEAMKIFDYGTEFMCPTLVEGKIEMRPRRISNGFAKSTFNATYCYYEEEQGEFDYGRE